ncbi:MAG: carbohydrate kinase family protein, partial [Planctomycetaceae bacterium]|nr:carbohydrate kinase family protein [Planctomycetaceae bacterium]
MARRTLVFGPAYLDRVVHVDRPLVDPALSPPLDQSVDGRWEFGEGLTLMDPIGSRIVVELPGGWPGPTGVVALSRPLPGGPPPWWRAVRGLSWHDDLGGMGAGFAAALGGELVSAVGPEDDPTSRVVADLLARAGIAHRPVRVPGRPADWTLLVTSGGFGDKLPIGFRGCHAALGSVPHEATSPCDLRVVGSLPNRLAGEALRAPGAAVRFFAPAMRNMLDRNPPLSDFAEAIDVLSCNRREWESLADREEVAWRVPVLAITDGPEGSTVRFTTLEGDPGRVKVPAFPRSHPPRDTNRAGEAYAATLLATLLDAGWRPGVVERTLVEVAATRASAAAALELDRADFGFPTPEEIDEALRAGRVGAGRAFPEGAAQSNVP